MRASRTTFVVPVVLAALAFASGCGSASTQGQNSTPSAPTTTPTPKVAHAGQSVDQVLAGLKAKGLPIGDSVTYTADNDQNHLLGRPGQYIGKANFKDTRVPDSGTQGVDISVDDGGSVEVCATLDAATKRTQYVQAIASSGGIFAEYDYQDGLVLLRVSKQLTPTQAQAYQTALTILP